MKHTILMGLLGLLVFGLTATPLQADFVQCTGGPCLGTDNADVINGTPEDDFIAGADGNDLIFGAGGIDEIDGDEGDDLLFGGLDDDFLFGLEGNDLIFPGADGPPDFAQLVNGDDGNDTTNVLVGDTTGCLLIEDDGGADVVNLIGFGPYSAQHPFGLPEFDTGYILVFDPVAGGEIWIHVHQDDDEGIETINGLVSPNVTFSEDFGEGCED